MFLNMLNKDEKEGFLDLAIKAVEANGDVAKEEIQMLHSFAAEMKIPSRTTTNRDLSIILKDFVDNSSKKSMKIVVFELISILYADGEFDEQEKKYLDAVTSAFGLDTSVENEMVSEINDYSALFNRICKTVL